MSTSEIDYRVRTTVPIRDFENDGRIFCLVDVYGVHWRDLVVAPDGAAPMRKAVERLGLDPNRYQASLWDLLDETI